MEGGRRIDDHSSWISADGKFAAGAKMKEMRSAEGAGGLSSYNESADSIKKDQEMGERKINASKIKPGYRR